MGLIEQYAEDLVDYCKEMVLDTNIIIGLDTRSDAWHAACTDLVPDSPGGAKFYAVVRATKHRDKDLERINLNMTAELFFQQAEDAGKSLHKAVHVFCEEPLALKNGKTTRLLGLAAGAIWAAHTHFNIYWHWVDVASWKKEIVGNGNASKEDIQEFCKDNPAWIREVGQSRADAFLFDKEIDLFDAWCLRTYGVRFLVRSKLGEGWRPS